MSFQSGFSGIPIFIKNAKRKSNPKILKQWQELDEVKREKREEERLRQEKLLSESKKTKRRAK